MAMRFRRKIQRFNDLPVVGWREWGSLPALGLSKIKMKVDTGAKTSALHATEVERCRKDSGDWVRFRLHAEPDEAPLPPVECPLVAQRRVKSSNGSTELRPVIKTLVHVGHSYWIAEVTLTSRSEMGFQMLLGREALKDRFLVDAGRSFLQSLHLERKNT